jgi:hypothetical protein
MLLNVFRALISLFLFGTLVLASIAPFESYRVQVSCFLLRTSIKPLRVSTVRISLQRGGTLGYLNQVSES